MPYRECQSFYVDSNFTEVCSWRSNWKKPSIRLDNGMPPNRRQAIIWTNADPIHWRICAAPGGDKLTHETHPNHPDERAIRCPSCISWRHLTMFSWEYCIFCFVFVCSFKRPDLDAAYPNPKVTLGESLVRILSSKLNLNKVRNFQI